MNMNDGLSPALLVAHGQPSDPFPAARALEDLAMQVAAFLPRWSVKAATLAEPLAIARGVAGRECGLVYPLFMARGWFTKVQIPNRLFEAGASRWKVLEPFGCDPKVQDLCVALVRESGADEVIVAAHGSSKSAEPSEVARHVAARIRAETGITRVEVGFIDQAPQLSTLTGFGPGAVCLPFFAAAGGHVEDDLPRALAEAGFRGRILPPVGADGRVPGLIASALLLEVPVCSGTCRWAGGQNP